MKVILVNGSPNIAGCTARALREIADVLQREGIETSVFEVGSRVIAGCTSCRGCRTLGKCVIDDEVNLFCELAAHADGFIFGTPVYYASANGTLTAFMDRVFYSGDKKLFAYKPAAAIASARRAGTIAAIDRLERYFALSQMPIVTSTYLNEVHGSTAAEVEKDEEGLATMRNLARNMAWLLRLREAGEKAGIPLPVAETGVRTSFIR